MVNGLFFDVYNELGPGFLESVYHRAFVVALQDASLFVESEVSILVFFRGVQVRDFSVDIVVEHVVLLELKAVQELNAVHEA